jgi:hypothetical protein
MVNEPPVIHPFTAWVGRHLRAPQSAHAGDFIDGVRTDLAEVLRTLDRGMPNNSGVRLDPRRRHPIIVSPLDPQPEPLGLTAIKAELGRRWPMTRLLDVLLLHDIL